MQCLTCTIGGWLKQPLPEDASVWDYFLFTGLIIIIILAWVRILAAAREI